MLAKESQKSRLVLPPWLDTIVAQKDHRMPVVGQNDPTVLLGLCKPLAATNSTVIDYKSLLCIPQLLWTLSIDFFNLHSSPPPPTLTFIPWWNLNKASRTFLFKVWPSDHQQQQHVAVRSIDHAPSPTCPQNQNLHLIRLPGGLYIHWSWRCTVISRFKLLTGAIQLWSCCIPPSIGWESGTRGICHMFIHLVSVPWVSFQDSHFLLDPGSYSEAQTLWLASNLLISYPISGGRVW